MYTNLDTFLHDPEHINTDGTHGALILHGTSQGIPPGFSLPTVRANDGKVASAITHARWS